MAKKAGKIKTKSKSRKAKPAAGSGARKPRPAASKAGGRLRETVLERGQAETLQPTRLRDPRAADLEIRELELNDIPAVFALGEKLFTPERWPNLYRTWDEYELVELFASDGETCFVAELDGRVVGFALGTMIEKRRSAWKYGYLLWLGADPEVGPLGIGGKLFHRLQEVFIQQGARIMLVDTAEENTGALQFFRRHGFGNEEGHVYLSKNLSAEPTYRRRHRQKLARTRQRMPPIKPPAPRARVTVDDEEFTGG